MFQGRVGFGQATLEAFRRGRAAVQSRRERAMIDELAAQPARLRPEFLSLSSADLLKHFRSRVRPSFFPGFQLSESTASRQGDFFPVETEELIALEVKALQSGPSRRQGQVGESSGFKCERG